MNVRHAPRAAGILLATVGAAAALAGCGGSTAATPTSSSTTAAANGRSSAITAYVACLNKNGVTVSVPTGGGTRPSGAPSGGTGGFGGGGGTPPSGRPTTRPSGGTGGFGGGSFGGGAGSIFGDASNPPTGVSQAAWTKALAACSSLKPSFTRGGTGGAAATAYLNCLKSHGVTATSLQGLNTADATTAAAMKTCAPLKPSATPTSS